MIFLLSFIFISVISIIYFGIYHIHFPALWIIVPGAFTIQSPRCQAASLRDDERLGCEVVDSTCLCTRAITVIAPVGIEIFSASTSLHTWKHRTSRKSTKVKLISGLVLRFLSSVRFIRMNKFRISEVRNCVILGRHITLHFQFDCNTCRWTISVHYVIILGGVGIVGMLLKLTGY